MAIPSGSRIGPYEILDVLGAGGMGEVYRARDTKLGRDVAIKVLHEEFTSDRERLARFEREAKLLASLNHPNIASVYGFEEAQTDARALVLELVEGPTLAERIQQGPVPVEDAIVIAKQVAEALEVGHEAGIIHRDLKPSNIKLKDDGTVKVLDYGLAKALAGDPTSATEPGLSQSPTLTRQGTELGVILGTAAYMSPEQAKGKRVDKRADIWAFGAVLYEMLTGRRTFSGETVSETLAEVLKSDPDWSRLPESVRPALRELLERCLTKDPRQRLRDIGEARVTLTRPLEGSPSKTGDASATGRRRFSWAAMLGGAVLAFALTALGIGFWPREAPRGEGTRRFTLRLDEPPRELTLSADGAKLAYIAAVGGTPQILLRSLDEEKDRVLAGTEDARQLFFSPDGRWVGFFTAPETQGLSRVGALKKVSVDGGAPVTLVPVARFTEAFWGSDDRIYFRADDGSIQRISGSGGVPEGLGIAPEGENWSLQGLLPGGEDLLVISRTALGVPTRVATVSLKSGKATTLVDGRVYYAFYSLPGRLVYFQAGRLLAQSFDVEGDQLTGAAVPLAEEVNQVNWDLSRDGALVYSRAAKRRFVWVSRTGEEEELPFPADFFGIPRLSPDGSRIALAYTDPMVENQDVWIFDLARGTKSRFTIDPEGDAVPYWSPDGTKVVFVSDGRERAVRFRSADGTGETETLLTMSHEVWPYSWSHDGKFLVMEEAHPESGSDIVLLSMDGEHTLNPLIREPFDQSNPVVSPDGRFLAYESNESGRVDVYVQQFPELGDKRQISTQGGTVPLWGREGRELFYREGDRVMAVAITTEPTFHAGEPRELFRGPYAKSPGRWYNYDPRGDRFLMMKDDASNDDAREVHFVLNVFDELERLAPTN